jgi:hypothetical protein
MEQQEKLKQQRHFPVDKFSVADVALKRCLWHKAQPSMDLARLVFIDESGAKTNMIRRYGRAIAGQRAVDDTPSGHWCTTTTLSSVRLDGSTACMKERANMWPTDTHLRIIDLNT